MGTQKRERQRQARQVKTVEQQAAARRQRAKRRGVRLAVGVVVVLAVALGYSLLTADDDDSSDEAATDETTTTADGGAGASIRDEVLGRERPFPANAPANIAQDAVNTETLIEGEGEGAAAGDTVVVHYVGVLSDGTEFDSSWEGEPFRVENLGQASVIDGWNEGLIGAKAGERRRLEIGSAMAYGAQGSPDGGIPPNAPLAFEIDVVDIERAGG